MLSSRVVWFWLLLLIWLAGLAPSRESPPVQQSGSRLELLHADVSRGQMENGILLRILEGNVHARQDTLDIYCDRAVYDESRKLLTLEGNVRLVRDGEWLSAERVHYFEQSKKAIAEGNVVVVRGQQQLRTPYLEYYYQTDRARARGGVFIQDDSARVVIQAREGEHLPAAQRSYVQGNAHFLQALPGEDTLHIFARFLEYRGSEPRMALARDSVRIQRGELEATCDSAVYFLDQEIAFLEIQPRAYQGKNFGRGQRMKLVFEQGQIRSIAIEGEAFFESPADSLGLQKNRLTGKKILARFSGGELQQVQAISQARSLYHLSEESGEKGINVATADTIKIFFVQQTLDSIAVLGGAEGIFYPEGYAVPEAQNP